jgi:hypothetical protein
VFVVGHDARGMMGEIEIRQEEDKSSISPKCELDWISDRFSEKCQAFSINIRIEIVSMKSVIRFRRTSFQE